MQVHYSNHKKVTHPIFVELVGLAGAGKTTLSRVLRERYKKIGIGVELELRKVKHIPIFISQAPFLWPYLLNGQRQSRRFTWDEIKTMVYLRAWPHVLNEQAAAGAETILLDHGPVFKMATLDAFGPQRLQHQDAANWWQNMFTKWASTLDFIIWLDAPVDILVDRINNRDQKHAVKRKPKSEAYDFLARYRNGYNNVLAKMAALDGPTLIQFDTSQLSIDQIAASIAESCDLEV